MEMATAGHRLIDSNRDETKEIFGTNPNPNNQDKDHRVQKIESEYPFQFWNQSILREINFAFAFLEFLI